MGVYYNKSQAPVPVTLSGGRSVLIPAKGRGVLTGEDESAPSLLAAKAAGLVVRLPDKMAEVPAASAASVSVQAPAALPVAVDQAPVVVAVSVPDEEVASASVSASTSAQLEPLTESAESLSDGAPEATADSVPTVDDGTASTALVVTDPGTRDGKRHRRQ